MKGRNVSKAYLLQVDNEDLDLGLQAGLLLLEVVDLDDEGLDVLLLLLETGGVLAADLLDLLGAGGGLGLVLALPGLGVAVGLDQLPLQVQAGLGLLFQLHADGLQLDLDLVEGSLQHGAPLKNEKHNFISNTVQF